MQAGVERLGPAAEGFEAFYVREYQAVVRLAYALSGSRLAAEDIAQDAFLRAFRDWDHIRQPSAWVRKVTVRRAGRTRPPAGAGGGGGGPAAGRPGPGRGRAPRGGRPGVAGRQGPAPAPVTGDRPPGRWNTASRAWTCWCGWRGSGA